MLFFSLHQLGSMTPRHAGQLDNYTDKEFGPGINILVVSVRVAGQCILTRNKSFVAST